MKVLYAILALSLAAIIVAVVATWWRLRWHLRRPHHTPPNGMDNDKLEAQPPSVPTEHAPSSDHTH